MRLVNNLRNIFGFLLKTAALPLALHLANFNKSEFGVDFLSASFSWSMLIIGFLGMLYSDLLILRFGEANAHLCKARTRLVELGVYARNRHPFFWSLSVYHLGILILNYGLDPLVLPVWLGLILVSALYLLTIQESNLSKTFGKRYAEYKQNTPFWHWKFALHENQQLRLLPQLIWVVGRLFVQNWYKIKVTGQAHIPHDKPFLIVANHESYLDPFLFGIFIPFETRFVTTADVFTTPIMRFLLKGIGTFPMRRHRQDLKSIRTMIRMVNKGEIVGIFPEGGRSIDGSPLPILTETLKLIQRCKVPILPVHLDGAYEIWPRWDSRRRHGEVSVTINPIIGLDAQVDLNILEERIQRSIFAQPKVFRPVKSKAITRGIQDLLWACVECQSRGTILPKSGTEIICSHCNTTWTMETDYTLVNQNSMAAHTLISWIDDIGKSVLSSPITDLVELHLLPEENVFLKSSLNKYSDETGVETSIDLELVLTNNRVVLFKNTGIFQSWNLDEITICTQDYYNSISIGVAGVRHKFFLPSDEASLKWLTYYETFSAL
jgi:1-acyl-sn-glycerol-3-phosphate acyltransferase